jgi:hypothetical protein
MVALPTLAVFIFLAQDRVEAIVTPVVVAVLWAAGMSLALSRAGGKLAPPLRIGFDELPPIGSLRQAMVSFVALLAVFDAGAVAYSLTAHQYLPVGIMLGVPAGMWDALRKAKRTEREMRGTLWGTSNFAWTSRSRSRYLVART